MKFPKLISIKIIAHYIIYLHYEDGIQGEVNLSKMKDKGVFKIWNKIEDFEKIEIDKERNLLKWPNEIEVDANALYLKIQNLTFNQWKEKQIHATAN